MKQLLAASLLAFVSLSSHAAEVSRERTPPADPVALQMYTLRDVGSVNQQMAMASRAGFRAVEVVGNQGVSAAVLKTLLERYGLTVSSSHEQLVSLQQNLDATIAFNKAIGNRVIVVPYLQPAERPTSIVGWQDLGVQLDLIGARLRQEGMRLAYHNHDFEMKKYRGKTALEWMVDASSAENLQLELDLAWVSRGGQNPTRLIDKYSQRLFALHMKDNAGVGVRDDERNFAPMGEGLLAWDEIVPAAKRTPVRWYIVEHDQPKDAQAIITTSRANLLAALKRNGR